MLHTALSSLNRKTVTFHGIDKVFKRHFPNELAQHLAGELKHKRSDTRNEKYLLEEEGIRKAAMVLDKKAQKDSKLYGKAIKMLHIDSILPLYYLLQPELDLKKSPLQDYSKVNLTSLKASVSDDNCVGFTQEAQALSKEFKTFSSLGGGNKIDIEVMAYTSYDFHFESYGLSKEKVSELNEHIYQKWLTIVKSVFSSNGINCNRSSDFSYVKMEFKLYEKLCEAYYQLNDKFKECVDEAAIEFKQREGQKQLYSDKNDRLATRGTIHEIALLALAIENRRYTCISHKGSMIKIINCINLFLKYLDIDEMDIQFLNIKIHEKLFDKMNESNPSSMEITSAPTFSKSEAASTSSVALPTVSLSSSGISTDALDHPIQATPLKPESENTEDYTPSSRHFTDDPSEDFAQVSRTVKSDEVQSLSGRDDDTRSLKSKNSQKLGSDKTSVEFSKASSTAAIGSALNLDKIEQAEDKHQSNKVAINNDVSYSIPTQAEKTQQVKNEAKCLITEATKCILDLYPLLDQSQDGIKARQRLAMYKSDFIPTTKNIDSLRFWVSVLKEKLTQKEAAKLDKTSGARRVHQ